MIANTSRMVAANTQLWNALSLPAHTGSLHNTLQECLIHWESADHASLWGIKPRYINESQITVYLNFDSSSLTYLSLIMQGILHEYYLEWLI